MADKFFYMSMGFAKGPYTSQQMIEFVKSGTIKAKTKCIKNDETSMPAEQFFGQTWHQIHNELEANRQKQENEQKTKQLQEQQQQREEIQKKELEEQQENARNLHLLRSQQQQQQILEQQQMMKTKRPASGKKTGGSPWEIARTVISAVIAILLIVQIVFQTQIIDSQKQMIDSQEQIAADSKQVEWEHKVTSYQDELFETGASSDGNAGWEIVSARRATSSGVALYECILKRRK